MSYASLTLLSPGSTPEIVLTAVTDGKAGERVNVLIYAATAHDAPLTIDVTGNDIVINCAGSPTGDILGIYTITTSDILAAELNAHPEASLLVSAAVATSSVFISPVVPQKYLTGAGPIELTLAPVMRVDETITPSLMRSISAPLSMTMASAMAATQIHSVSAPSEWLTDNAMSITAVRNAPIVSIWNTDFTCRVGAIQSVAMPSTWSWETGCNLTSTHDLSVPSNWRMDVGLSLTVIKSGLTVCDVIRDILLCWGIEYPCSAPDMVKTAALNILNSGMQVLWNQAKDRNYWTQSTIDLAFSSGTSSLVIDDLIQNVIGPARLSTGEPLVPLANISESESFSGAFLEDDAPLKPVGYFVERNYQSGADPAKCTVILSPTPTANVTVRLDVVKEAPRFTILDLESCPVCPVPHKYVESILMPVCRYLSMHSHLFSNREREKAIVAGYTEARALLDVADPLPGQSGENIGYRKEERDKS